MISRQEAHAQGAALSAAAKHSPVGPLRDQLRAMSLEWIRALADYDAIMGPPTGEEPPLDRVAVAGWVTAAIGAMVPALAEPEAHADTIGRVAFEVVDRLRPDLAETEPGDGAAIVLVGICGPGMWAVAGGLQDDDFLRVIRVLHSGGQSSLHLEGSGGRDVYRNFMGPLSPVVVRA